jgi:hypothetical protein
VATVIRYEIDLRQRSGKWVPQCERNTQDEINAEWYRITETVKRRLRENRKTLRCTKIENGTRTILANYVP